QRSQASPVGVEFGYSNVLYNDASAYTPNLPNQGDSFPAIDTNFQIDSYPTSFQEAQNPMQENWAHWQGDSTFEDPKDVMYYQQPVSSANLESFDVSFFTFGEGPLGASEFPG